MAIVADLSGNFPASLPSGIDQGRATINRVLPATPLGSETPLYVGEIVQDTSTGQVWYAAGLTNDRWVEYGVVV